MLFGFFSEDVTCAHPPSSHSVGMLVVLATSVKNYLKWWAIQLAIQCTADTVNYLEWL